MRRCIIAQRMILTTLPDLAPRPQTEANAEFRRRFYARWGRENAVVCGRAVHAEYAEFAQTLSIKMAAGGRERYFLARREVAVDDDNFLVLNEGARYGSLLRAALPGGPPAWTFAVFFRPGMQREVAAARAQRLGAALDAPGSAGSASGVAPSPVGFAEHLRPHGGALSQRLRHLAGAVQAGERDELWLEEQCTALLDATLDAEAAPRPDAGARAAQRTELQRRLRVAADFIESHYTEPLTLERMAEVACLSRYHFVREFARAFGLSPHAWLTRKRARAARRCLREVLREGSVDREMLAFHCGFGSRWALMRALARLAADESGAPTDPRH